MKKNNVLYPLLGLRIHLNRCLPMKLMILLIFVFSIPAFSAAYSQEGSVSFSAENMRVEEIIKHVRNISGYKFLFNHEELRSVGTKSVKFANTPIRDVMNEVLRGTNLTYRLEKDVIVIYPMVVTTRDSVQKSVTVKGVVKDNIAGCYCPIEGNYDRGDNGRRWKVFFNNTGITECGIPFLVRRNDPANYSLP